MAGISFSRARQASYPDTGVWANWMSPIVDAYFGVLFKNLTNEYPLICYEFNVDYTNARSIQQLSFTVRGQDSGQGCTFNVGAYVYTSDPTGGSVTSVPSGYVASGTGSVTIPANNASMSKDFNITIANIGASTSKIYVILKLTSKSGNTTTFTGRVNLNSLTPIFKGMPTSFSVSPSTVSTGGKVNVNIGNAWSTETVQFYYGNTLLGSSTITNGSGQVTIPKSWFTTAGITTAQSMTVTAKLVSTTRTQTFTVQAGSDMKPTVGTPTVSIVQDPSASEFPNTYIANLSKAKVRAAVSSGSNASISSVKVTWSGGTADMSVVSGGYEAVIGPLTGNTTITVVATDSRGMTQQASYSLTGVVQYAAPVITIIGDYTYRCDSSGLKEDGGAYVRAAATAAISTAGLSGNSIQSFRFYILEEPSKGSSLENGAQCPATVGRTFDFYETLVFEVSDKIVTTTKSLRLPPGTRNFTMKRSADGTYVGIGVLPQHSSGPSTVDIEEGGAYYEGGFLWGSLTRLNSYSTDGSQFAKNFLQIDTDLLNAPCHADAYFNMTSTSGWSNLPVSSTPFKGYRKVIFINSSNIFVVILEAAPTVGRIWVNFYNGSAWSGWKKLTPA